MSTTITTTMTIAGTLIIQMKPEIPAQELKTIITARSNNTLKKNPFWNKTPNPHKLYRSHLGLLGHLNFSQLPLPLGYICVLLIGWNRVDTLGFPSGYSFLGLNYFAFDNFGPLAQLALNWDRWCFIDQLHATGFTCSVFFVTVGAESSPLMVVAGEDLLVVETHFCESVSRGGRLISCAKDRWVEG